MVLSEQDVNDLAETVEPGSSAAVLVWGEPVGRAVRRSGAPRRGPAGRQRPHSHPGGAGRHRSRRRGRSLTCHLQPDAAGGPPQQSAVPWSSHTVSTAGATGARTAATTEETAAKAAATVGGTKLER